jgi:hypothetical protein
MPARAAEYILFEKRGVGESGKEAFDEGRIAG